MSEHQKNEQENQNSEQEVQENKWQNEIKGEASQEQPEAEPDYNAIIADLNDKLLRTAAEMQNTRRRAEMDVQKAKNFSIESFARDLLTVMDSLSHATNAISQEDAATDPKLKSMKDGVEITKKELEKVFERQHIKSVGKIGEVFDPNIHQAMVQLEVKDQPSGTIADVMQVGYTIRDRSLRPALVAVVK
jgi:molecular chaperone GrpE